MLYQVNPRVGKDIESKKSLKTKNSKMGSAENKNQENCIRRSVEVEYWVIDKRGRLVEPGELIDASEGVEREFVKPLIEIKTTPCETTQELSDELLRRLSRVLEKGEELGKRLVPLATPINSDGIEEIPGERTRIQNKVVGESFGYVRHCAGTHVHIEQQPGKEVDQLNSIIAIDPALALVNSSPWLNGDRIAVGARSRAYRWMAYDGVAHQGRLWSYVDSLAEWRLRLERRYEEFVTAAVDRGIDPEVVEENFDSESTVWIPTRLRDEFGTVEWRSPDAALPTDVVSLADGVADIVGRVCDSEVRIRGESGWVNTVDDEVVLPEFDSVLAYLEDAIRDGLRSHELMMYLKRLGFDIDRYSPVSRELAQEGPVSQAEARSMRLSYADRLREDVQRAGPGLGFDAVADD
jgi:gamma-glutamyl:cysteine ligase YbdK (ATP-grasp superfamily)